MSDFLGTAITRSTEGMRSEDPAITLRDAFLVRVP